MLRLRVNTSNSYSSRFSSARTTGSATYTVTGPRRLARPPIFLKFVLTLLFPVFPPRPPANFNIYPARHTLVLNLRRFCYAATGAMKDRHGR